MDITVGLRLVVFARFGSISGRVSSSLAVRLKEIRRFARWVMCEGEVKPTLRAVAGGDKLNKGRRLRWLFAFRCKSWIFLIFVTSADFGDLGCEEVKTMTRKGG